MSPLAGCRSDALGSAARAVPGADGRDERGDEPLRSSTSARAYPTWSA